MSYSHFMCNVIYYLISAVTVQRQGCKDMNRRFNLFQVHSSHCSTREISLCSISLAAKVEHLLRVIKNNLFCSEVKSNIVLNHMHIQQPQSLQNVHILSASKEYVQIDFCLRMQYMTCQTALHCPAEKYYSTKNLVALHFNTQMTS